MVSITQVRIAAGQRDDSGHDQICPADGPLRGGPERDGTGHNPIGVSRVSRCPAQTTRRGELNQ